MTTTDNQQDVPVILRVWRDNDKVFAIFPTLPSDYRGNHCTAYAHIGQHSGADYGLCIRESRPAFGLETQPLILELNQRGYRLRIVQRASASMHQARKVQAKAYLAGVA